MRTKETPTLRTIALSAVALSALSWGCASKGFVETRLAGDREQTDQRLTSIEDQVERVQDDVLDNRESIQDLDERSHEISKTAAEALERATEAGKLAEGKFLYETVLTDDSIRFDFGRAAIGDDADRALAVFAEGLELRDQPVFIEIQGHTDATGPEEVNRRLGLERAEAVRQHLYRNYRVPLHRMEVISYGETEPLTDNSTREARAQNRRVTLVVLR